MKYLVFILMLGCSETKRSHSVGNANNTESSTRKSQVVIPSPENGNGTGVPFEGI